MSLPGAELLVIQLQREKAVFFINYKAMSIRVVTFLSWNRVQGPFELGKLSRFWGN